MSIIIEQEIMSNEFNASITVTDLLMKTLENTAKDLIVRCVNDMAKRHGFDADEELRILGLENFAVNRRQMAKREKGEKKEKKSVEKKEKKEKKEKQRGKKPETRLAKTPWEPFLSDFGS